MKKKDNKAIFLYIRGLIGRIIRRGWVIRENVERRN